MGQRRKLSPLAHGKQGLKLRAATMQIAASLNFPFMTDDITQNLNFLIIKTDR